MWILSLSFLICKTGAHSFTYLCNKQFIGLLPHVRLCSCFLEQRRQMPLMIRSSQSSGEDRQQTNKGSYELWDDDKSLVKIKQGKKERGTRVGLERHSDKVRRHAETQVSHADICVGEKEHSKQRKHGDKGPAVGVRLESLGRARRPVCLEQWSRSER